MYHLSLNVYRDITMKNKTWTLVAEIITALHVCVEIDGEDTIIVYFTNLLTS